MQHVPSRGRQRLRELLLAYTKECAALLTLYGEWSGSTIERPDVIGSHAMLSSLDDDLPSRKPLDQLLASPPWRDLLERAGHGWVWHGEVVADLFVERVLQQSRGEEVDLQVFETAYRDLLAELASPRMRLRHVTVVDGYPRPGKPTTVAGLGRLVPFDLSDGYYLLYQELRLEGQRDVREGVHGRGFLLVQDTTFDKQGHDPNVFGRHVEQLQARRDDALALMQLTHSGVVEADATYLVQISRFPLIPPSGRRYSDSGSIGWFESSLSLSAALRRRLRAAQRVITAPDQALRTALSRFSRSYRRTETGQNIVDLVVALEGLLGLQAEELKMRLAQRCALLLGDGAAGSRKVYSDVRAAYEIRNLLVHGQSKPETARAKLLKQANTIEAAPSGLAKDVADKEALWRAGHRIRDYARQAIWAYARLHGHLGGKAAWPSDDRWGELLFDPDEARQLRRLARRGNPPPRR